MLARRTALTVENLSRIFFPPKYQPQTVMSTRKDVGSNIITLSAGSKGPGFRPGKGWTLVERHRALHEKLLKHTLYHGPKIESICVDKQFEMCFFYKDRYR